MLKTGMMMMHIIMCVIHQRLCYWQSVTSNAVNVGSSPSMIYARATLSIPDFKSPLEQRLSHMFTPYTVKFA